MDFGYVRIKSKKHLISEQIDILKSAGCEAVFVESDSPLRFPSEHLQSPQKMREQLSACFKKIGKGDSLVVFELLQLELPIRGLIHLLNRLEYSNIALKSISESIDTNAKGCDLNRLSMVFEQLDNQLASERSKRSIAIAKAKGRLSGRPLRANPDALDVARTLIEEGVSVRNTAKQTAISQATLYRRVGAKS